MSGYNVIDAQFLGPRHQLSMLHYWLFYITVTAEAALKNSHTAPNFPYAALSNYRQYVVLNNQYVVLNH